MMNSTQILKNMQSSFPHIYNVYDDNSVLYALLSVYANRYANRNQILTRLYGMIGIDTTYDEDLERRWGSLLGVYRNNGESMNDYRARLMIVYASLAGGTEEAIKYAVASTIGISDDPNLINEYIKIYDAWLYDKYVTPNEDDPTYDPITNSSFAKTNDGFILNKDYDIHKYGAFVCTVDIGVNEGISAYYDKIMHAINITKASGIAPYLVFLYITHEVASIVIDDNEKIVIHESSTESGRIVGCPEPYFPLLNSERHTNVDFILNERLSEYWHTTEQLFDDIVITDNESGNIDRAYNSDYHYNRIIFAEAVDNIVLRSIDKIDDIVSVNTTDIVDISHMESIIDSPRIRQNEDGDISSDLSTSLYAYSLVTNENFITNKYADTDHVAEMITDSQYDDGDIKTREVIAESIIEDNVDRQYITNKNDIYIPMVNNMDVTLNGGFITNIKKTISALNDKFIDAMKQSIHEVRSLPSVASGCSFFGTNTSHITLNDGFITNMQMDTDICMDKIFRNGDTTPTLIYN